MPLDSSAYDGARRAALLSVALAALMYVMCVVFQSDDRPWRVGWLLWLPALALVAAPLAFAAWRLSRPADVAGLVVGMAASATILVLVARTVAQAMRTTDGPLGLLTAILYFHITGLVFVALFLPMQVKLLLGAVRAALAQPTFNVAGFAVAAVLAVGYVSAARRVVGALDHSTSTLSRRSSYSSEPVERQMARVYECLWRVGGPGAVNGFPPSLDAVRALGPACWDPKDAPDGESYGTYYDFRYTPAPPNADGRIRGFGIATRKRTAPGSWTESFFLDHRGVFRRDVRTWASEGTDRVESDAQYALPYVIDMLDDFRERHGAYPARLLDSASKADATPNDLVLPHDRQPFLGVTVRHTDAGASVLDFTEFGGDVTRRVTYGPRGTARYTLTLRPGKRGLRSYRSYFVDEWRRIHSTGEDREATERDPVVPLEEFDLLSRNIAAARKWRNDG